MVHGIIDIFMKAPQTTGFTKKLAFIGLHCSSLLYITYLLPQIVVFML